MLCQFGLNTYSENGSHDQRIACLKTTSKFFSFFPVAHLIWPLMSPKRKKKSGASEFFLFLVPLFLTPASSVACCAVSFWGGSELRSGFCCNLADKLAEVYSSQRVWLALSIVVTVII